MRGIARRVSRSHRRRGLLLAFRLPDVIIVAIAADYSLAMPLLRHGPFPAARRGPCAVEIVPPGRHLRFSACSQFSALDRRPAKPCRPVGLRRLYRYLFG